MVAGSSPSSRARAPRRGDVYWVDLDPTQGSEIRKTRPCVIVSPDELNQHLRTVLIAPLTTGGRPYPWRVECRIQGQQGRVALDQLRTVDRERLVRYVEQLPEETLTAVLTVLADFFAE